jgi:prepilin-type N-terminal cleavage/methylation domain-containing protein|tara:strand:- start:11114 stop:11671 length:558 start_codon:yes stop_codon:yes gene_type:complete
MKKKGFTQHLLLGHKQSNHLTSKKGAGFTLIELLVVIAIIGLLATFAAIALDSAREKSRDAKRVADVKNIQTALELFFNSNTSYPDLGASSSYTLGVDVDCLDGGGFDTSCSDPIYIGLVPDDPQSPTYDFVYAAETGDEVPIACEDFGECVTYTIDFYLEGGAGDLSGGDKCATPSGISDGVCP